MASDSGKGLFYFIIVLAIALILAGGTGWAVCILFMFSENIVDVTGAGLGFVTGGILIGSGTIALAIIWLAKARNSE